MANGTNPVAPKGFRVHLFARDIESPRFLLVLPNDDVLVSQSSFTPDVFGDEQPPAEDREA